MGYEILYKFHEEISKGEYNKEELKEKTVKIGTPSEDVPLEVLAGKVISQLASRKILVVDVEIHEFVKKKLTFKETDDGIIIKNRKFRFDDGAVLGGEEIPSEEVSLTPQQQFEKLIAANPNLINNKITPSIPISSQTNNTNTNQNIVPSPPTSFLGKPIRYELFNPFDKAILADAKKRGLAFTVGKKYPIYNEKPSPVFNAGMLYTTVDDKGMKQILSDKLFTPDVNLGDEFTEEFVPAAMKNYSGDTRLSWSDSGNYADAPMPKLR